MMHTPCHKQRKLGDLIDAVKSRDERTDYGVPTGSVPRVSTYQWAQDGKTPPAPRVFDQGDHPPMKPLVRSFETGATRSADAGRYDPEGFMSPIVIERFSEYMNKHRAQPDGSVRDSDNWQKGIPTATYMKGLWRHFLHLWTRHRGYVVQDPMATANMEEDLCSIMFNAQGMLFEVLKEKRK